MSGNIIQLNEDLIKNNLNLNYSTGKGSTLSSPCHN